MRNDHGGHSGHGPSGNEPSADLLAQMGYETRDVSLNVLGKWLIYLWVFIAAMTGIGFATYKILVPNYAEQEKSSPIPHVRNLPPYPQLQVDPHRDIMEYKQAEEDVISGSVNNGGKPSISIAQAMDTLANQKGIAGMRGDAVRQMSDAYPGSGAYETAPAVKMADPPPTMAEPSAPTEETK